VIVIPMAGASGRFHAEGFTRPKYELTARNTTLFELSVASFARYFATEPFLFVVRRDFDAARFVHDACRRLGVAHPCIVELGSPTGGQAQTVAIGLEQSGVAASEPLTVFNIDTFRPDFAHVRCEDCDGYLEVFQGEGSHWSFVEPIGAGSTRVRRTAEKQRISDLCSTGLYHFARVEYFRSAFRRAARDAAYLRQWRELYVAPLYNFLIADGLRVHYRLIGRDEVIFSGTPSEYRALCATA
jgi:ribosomal protein S27E